jgi:endonuclease-3 related protein
MASANLQTLYRVLREAYGHRRWWPAQSPWEMMAGAVLTQNTNWKNVERAIEALRRAEVLEPRRILELPLEELQTLIRPAGYFRQKAARLRALADWFVRRLDADPAALRAMHPLDLREELLAIRGIGRETADSICLYAAGKPVFVVDAYTARVCARHGLIPRDADYEEIREYFESSLPPDVELFRDFHAQFVEVGKRYCRRRPRCTGCPVPQALGPPRLEPEELEG